MRNMSIARRSFFTAVSLMLVSIGLTYAEDLPTGKAATHECRRATGKIVIDGRIDEAAWKNAQAQQYVLPVTLGTPVDETEARVLWDDQYLYVAYKAKDKDIWSYYTKRDDWTSLEDCLEIFFKPDLNSNAYYDFEVNVLGTILDALILRRYTGDDLHRWMRWNAKGLKVGIYVKGTLNNPNDVDEYWQLELAIPFSELSTIGGKTPKPGDMWRVNLARCNYSTNLPDGYELSSAQTEPGTRAEFHAPNLWNYLKFVK